MRSPSSSRPPTTLTGEDRERYWRDGYVLFRGLIDKETLDRIDARFLALVTGEATSTPGSTSKWSRETRFSFIHCWSTGVAETEARDFVARFPFTMRPPNVSDRRACADVAPRSVASERQSRTSNQPKGVAYE
jgi:hypothetical protein